MTPTARRNLLLALLLAAACVIHAALGASMSIKGARPDLGLAMLLVGCLFVPAGTGAWLGFLAGLMQSSYMALDVGSFLTTRSLAGWAIGALEERVFRDNALVALAAVGVGTFLVQGCFYLFAPQPHLVRWLTRTALETAYNTALAIPLYLLVKRVLRGRQRW